MMIKAVFGIVFFPVIVLLDMILSPIKVTLKESVQDTCDLIKKCL